MKKTVIAALCALGALAQASAADPVLVLKTKATTDTLTYRVYISPVDSRSIDRKSMRTLELLPGSESVVLEATEADANPAHYYVYEAMAKGMKNIGDAYRAPGETITIDMTNGDAELSGSALTDSIKMAMNSLTTGMEALSAARAAKDEAAFNAALAQIRSTAADYIKAHPNSPGSIELLSMLEPDQMAVAELITPAAKTSLNGGMYDVYLNMLKAQKQRMEQAAKVAPGKPAPDFTLPSSDGKSVSLSSLKGKYVMLDFWGSWCGWCIKGIPQMKEQYEKLKDKVYFVSVACNDSKEKWEAALEKYEMPWIQLWSDPSTPAPEQVSTLYAVEGYPTKLVIDPEGKIVTKVAGEDPSFYDIFDELLK